MEYGSSQFRVPKVVLTQTVSEQDKHIIMSHSRFNDIPIVEGKLINYEVEKSFAVYGGLSTELVDSHVVSSTSAAMIVTIVLEGRLTFGYDDLEFQLDGNRQAEAVLVNLTQASSFNRSIEKNNRLLKINLLFHSNWLLSRLGGQETALPFASQHLSYLKIPVSQSLNDLTLQIIGMDQPRDFKTQLQVEATALQILTEIISHATSCTEKKATNETSVIAQSRIEDVLNYIELHLSHTLNIDTIASHFSMSGSNLQRLFRQQVGITINSYIRQRRLRNAKLSLEKGLTTITEAAYEAGYSHPANFTIAFKKTFGVPPTKVVKNECSRDSNAKRSQR